MKLAHTAIVTPHRSGLYETTRDIVAAEIALGHDAWIVDPSADSVDRGVPIGRGIGLDEADVIVNHSGLGKHEPSVKVPVIHCLHGRPESSFRLEANGKTGVYSFVSNAASNGGIYKRFVTFWEAFVPYWSMLIPQDRLTVVSAPVDLEAWTPDGPSGYKFGGKRGEINIVIADMWRDDVTPYHAIHAFCAFAEKHPKACLHIYGVKRHTALDVLLGAVKARGWLGEATGMVQGLANVYRAADVLLSPHTIATRAIREAQACGCPVVWGAADVSEMVSRLEMALTAPTSMSRQNARLTAEENYDSKNTAKQMLKIAEEVLSCPE